MKKLVVFLAAAFLAVNVSASQGAMVLSGGLGLNVQNESPEVGDGETNTYFEISPSFLYFLSDRFAVGGQLGLNLQLSSLDNRDTGTLFSIGVAGRYYVLKTQRLGVFAHAALDFGFANDNYDIFLPADYWRNERLNNLISFGITPGVQFFFNERWSAEAYFAPVLSFVHLNTDVTNNWWGRPTTVNEKTNDFNLNLNPFQATINPLRIALNFHF